ncbi:hypothetical protein [Achromobacter xylosoxidans]|uniref:hypothetical protein n=1 Tax=Alcaligenes xylosoxydans xylosoxydans TaxID=85698 RepID=UPI0006C16997|nr:hypothetical protein [Achromobacter xylosoxidans]CUI56038.1 Uncharacterised protein [Achromobacter xylosoxidans]
MTNQNNAAQAAEQEIREAFELIYAADADDPACAADLFHFTNGWRTCIMSQVRAPVAGERAAFKKCHSAIIKSIASIARADGPDTRKEDDPELLYRSPVMDEVVRIRVALDECSAALASAPVAEPGTMEEIHRQERERSPWVLPKDPTLPDSAPVAGEAQGWSGWACQYPNKLPRLYGSKEIAQLNCDAANGDRVLFLSEHAAPQASAEDVRNAALEEAIQALSRITTSYATFTSGNPQYRPESRPASAAIAEAIDTLRALKTQADKDGGQQRACTCHADDRPAGDCQKQYAATDCQQRAGDECKHARAHRAGDRQGYACPDCGEFVSDYEIHRRQRAALSAPQADGIRRPLPYIDSTQEPSK